jgi:hypothetical protein
MNNSPLFDHNRVILSHFDSYSAALVFARFGSSVLATVPLPEVATPIAAPAEVSEQHSPGAVLNAVVTHFGIATEKINLDGRFQAWMSGDSGPIRIHLVRFTTQDAPHQSIEPFGGVFKPISEMRKLPMIELNLMRQVFNQTLGGG